MKENKSLSKINFIIIGVALTCIVLGFALTYGESSGLKFNPDVFSFRRITFGPMLALAGFVIMIFGIMHKKKEK
jgi:formate hydrogenlyase subunit 3/multisubunit Na+/H+ antiporter MnhD subunit